MEKRELNVVVRDEVGKGVAKKLRAKQFIPAVFYGPHMEKPITLSLHTKDLLNLRAGGSNVLLTLKTATSSALDGKMALLKDKQIHPVSGKPVHVDLFEVRMDEEIKVSVSVVLTGKAIGVAEGGILQQVTRELEVRCLPANVPDKITLDISALNVGESIHVNEMTLPNGVKVVGTVNYTIAAVVAPEEEIVATPAAGATEPGIVGAAPVEGAAPGAAPAAGAAAAKPGDKAAAPAKAAGGKDEKKAEGKK